MYVSVLVFSAVEMFNVALYFYVHYKSNATYYAYCVNQARLNIASRLALEQCIKFSATMLHIAAVHFTCSIIASATLYGLFLFQNYKFVQRHHVDVEVQFNEGAVLIILIAYPMISLVQIPVLKMKLKILFGWEKSNVVAPMIFSTLMNQQDPTQQSESDVRFLYLARQWATAVPSKPGRDKALKLRESFDKF